MIKYILHGFVMQGYEMGAYSIRISFHPGGCQWMTTYVTFISYKGVC